MDTIVGHHLRWATGDVLGNAVTPEIAMAWDEVYWLSALQLVAEEAKMYAQGGVDPEHAFREYTVVERTDETQNCFSMTIEPVGGELPAHRTGQYVAPGDTDAPLILVSAGIGITPMAAIVEDLAQRQQGRTVRHVHTDRGANTHALVASMRADPSTMTDFAAQVWYEQDTSDGALAGRMELTGVEIPEGAQHPRRRLIHGITRERPALFAETDARVFTANSVAASGPAGSGSSMPDLSLRPLAVLDAAAMSAVLAAPSLYTFTGGEPPTSTPTTRHPSTSHAPSG